MYIYIYIYIYIYVYIYVIYIYIYIYIYIQDSTNLIFACTGFACKFEKIRGCIKNHCGSTQRVL